MIRAGYLDGLLLFSSLALPCWPTPGPNLMYLISRTLCQGAQAGIVSLAGTTTGIPVHVLAAALGLSAIFITVPVPYDAVRWAGAAYLLWLAWSTRCVAGHAAECSRRAPAPCPPPAVSHRPADQHPQPQSRDVLSRAVSAVCRSASRGSVLLQGVSCWGRRRSPSLSSAIRCSSLRPRAIARWLGERPAWTAVQALGAGRRVHRHRRRLALVDRR